MKHNMHLAMYAGESDMIPSAGFRAHCIALLLVVSVPAIAIDVPAGVTVVTAPEVRTMVHNNKAVLVHTLSRIEYQIQHIPDSMNIPVDEIETSVLMPANKSTVIVFYCNGEACPYSKRAAKSAVNSGYSKVYWFRGGILEWRKYQYPMIVDKKMKQIRISKLGPAEFRKNISEDVLVLDVRPQWWRQSEVQAGVIKGTNMMIPLLNLDKQIGGLSKDRPILIVDRLMRQSLHAAKYLSGKGYRVIGVLKGGSKRWKAEGYPILKQSDEPAMLIGATQFSR